MSPTLPTSNVVCRAQILAPPSQTLSAALRLGAEISALLQSTSSKFQLF
jgi:hypothetical protein